ncbi:MAG: NAD(P)H-dependent glycerol-3-phosphate dehydrogenase [Alphaproteobacteria bacterium]
MSEKTRIGVIGGGAWGTALATAARRGGCTVTLWAREAEVVEAINRRHVNTGFLPGIALDPAIHATGDLAEAAVAEALLLVTPAQHTRQATHDLRAVLAPGTPVVICAKGIETGSGALMSEVLAETLPETPVAVLSGPSFAAEVARDLPTAVTLAASDIALAERLALMIGSTHFRPYHGDDPVGTQIGGAVKNVMAIACGIAKGRGLGDNTGAALITRGLAEMALLGKALGARRETLMGLSGLGDLVLTCSHEQSRNFTLGMAVGQGTFLDDYLAGRMTVAEGVASVAATVALAARHKVDMPIANAVDAVLNRRADIDLEIAALLGRPASRELG